MSMSSDYIKIMQLNQLIVYDFIDEHHVTRDS